MEPCTITYKNPNTGFEITSIIPAEIVTMLQWMRDNVMLPQYAAPAPEGASEVGQPPVPKYQHEAHVIYRDVLEQLVPQWGMIYGEGQVAQLRAQVTAAEHQIRKAIKDGVANLIVVEPGQ